MVRAVEASKKWGQEGAPIGRVKHVSIVRGNKNKVNDILRKQAPAPVVI